MKKFILSMIALLMAFSMTVNAQNSIVDVLKETNKIDKSCDESVMKFVTLDPNKSITENYGKIDSLMSLHEEKNFAKYIIEVEGHYTSKLGGYYDAYLGIIRVKGKNNEYYRTISGQIIYVLTELYSHSLDTRFDVEFLEQSSIGVNSEIIKVPTGKTFKSNDGKVTKEYVEKKSYCNVLYYLISTSSLYKKIYNKVIEETGLEDGGRLYDLEHKRYYDN